MLKIGRLKTVSIFALVPMAMFGLFASVQGRPQHASVKATPKQAITWKDDVEPIVMNKCVYCHQPGGIGPFSLVNYDDVKRHATTIDAVIASRYMPPWKPVAGYGEFSGERTLTEEQVSTIRSWIKDGAPSDGAIAPASVPSQLLAGGAAWKSGPPDLILRMPTAYQVAPDGPDVYRCFVFPLNNADMKFVSHVEFHSGNTKVVHHALFFLDNNGIAKAKDAQNSGTGFQSFGGPGFRPTGVLGGYAPGTAMRPLPAGVARVVKPHSDLVIQMHFHPDGKQEAVQSEIGIYFTRERPEKILLPLHVGTRKIDIAPGEKQYNVSCSTTVPVDFDVLQITPHAHLLCQQIKCDATTPKGVTIPLIWVKNWDFNWQEQYSLKAPVRLPEGTTIQATFTYDNSEDNFRNPNHPPNRVTWGEGTTDEMALIFLGGTLANNADLEKYLQGVRGRRSSPD